MCKSLDFPKDCQWVHENDHCEDFDNGHEVGKYHCPNSCDACYESDDHWDDDYWHEDDHWDGDDHHDDDHDDDDHGDDHDEDDWYHECRDDERYRHDGEKWGVSNIVLTFGAEMKIHG